MKLIIGLGNPGEKYKKNRHNAGFIILDELKKIWNFHDFEFFKKFNAEISEGNPNPLLSPGESAPLSGADEGASDKIILAKPQTFMNNSGEAAREIMDFHKITLENITVIHDDLDINLGEYKISTGSSSAGHNGIESLIEKLGTQNFKRIRVGIEGSEKRKNRVVPGDVFVLQNFSDEELEIIRKLAKEIKF